eukprot:3290786-Rhodomonas_salina.1
MIPARRRGGKCRLHHACACGARYCAWRLRSPYFAAPDDLGIPTSTAILSSEDREHTCKRRNRLLVCHILVQCTSGTTSSTTQRCPGTLVGTPAARVEPPRFTVTLTLTGFEMPFEAWDHYH